MSNKVYTPDNFTQGHRFAVGNIGGGRKKGSKRDQCVERWQKLCKGKHTDRVYWALLNAAIGGDIAAIRLYLQYSQGIPKEQLEIINKQEETRNLEDIRTEFNSLFRNN